LGRATPPAVAAEFTKTRRHYALDPEFERKHPRGRPENRGRFREKPNTGNETRKSREVKGSVKRETRSLLLGDKGVVLRFDSASVPDLSREKIVADHLSKTISLQVVYRPEAREWILPLDARARHAEVLNNNDEFDGIARLLINPANGEAAIYTPETILNDLNVSPQMERVLNRKVSRAYDLAQKDLPEIVTTAGKRVRVRIVKHMRYDPAVFAVDPEFEKKHPRGRGEEGGQFIEKPGEAPPPEEEGEAGISASRQASPRVLEAMRRLLTDANTAKLRGALEKIEGVQPTGAIGRWEDGVEPSLAVRWKDGLRVRGELARLAKEYDQDAVLLWTDNAGSDARLSVQFHTSPPPRLLDAAHQALTKAQIPGSSYLAAGREIVVYAPEGERDAVRQRLAGVLQSLQISGNILMRNGKFELIFRDDYDKTIAAAGAPATAGARTHATKTVEQPLEPEVAEPAEQPQHTGEAMFLSDILARAFAKQMRTKSESSESSQAPAPPKPKLHVVDFTLRLSE
jgi:hypothetical protein